MIRTVILLLLFTSPGGFISAQSRAGISGAGLRILMGNDGCAGFVAQLQRASGVAPDLVVGFPNPNEVREINTPLEAGNIIVLNNGQLRCNNAEVRVAGNILLVNNGQLMINGGSLHLEQAFHFERSVVVLNKASLWFLDSRMSGSNYGISVVLADTSVFRMDAADFPNGFPQVLAGNFSSVLASNTSRVGEYLLLQNAEASFTNCSGLLSWINANAGSDVDITLPVPGLVESFVYPDSARKASGVTTRIHVRNCIQTVWGFLSETGAKARVAGSTLHAAGAIFLADAMVEVRNLLNNTSLNGYSFPASDRQVTFDGSTVRSWSLFPAGRSNIQIHNSIFGQLLALGDAQVLVVNSMCDGTGGLFGSYERARVTAYQSQILTDVLGRGQSFTLLYFCNIPTGAINLIDNAAAAILNTPISSLPSIGASAAAAIGSIDEPARGEINRLLPVYGSALVIAGSDVQVYLDHYFLDVHQSAFPDNPIRIGNAVFKERYRDTLGVWNTTGLLPGEYVLRLNMVLNTGDTLQVIRPVTLSSPTAVGSPSVEPQLSILDLYPHPVRTNNTSFTTVVYAIPARLSGTPVHIELVDGSGRCLQSRQEWTASPGVHGTTLDLRDLSAGTYVLRMQAGGACSTHPIVIVR